MLHISAHGVFGLRHADGRYRSGVLLSDGLLITAAEIGAMEVVPDVVFLNCCHLGTVDVGRQGNKLAASIARELIDIGVRCVIVAGWAVNDQGAQRFGEAFYEELLLRRRPFGEAVFQARKAVYERQPGRHHLGRLPGLWRPGLARRTARTRFGRPTASAPFASPEELLDELARIRAELSRRSALMNDRDQRAQVAALESLLKKRCQPGWLQAPGAAVGDRLDLARPGAVRQGARRAAGRRAGGGPRGHGADPRHREAGQRRGAPGRTTGHGRRRAEAAKDAQGDGGAPAGEKLIELAIDAAAHAGPAGGRRRRAAAQPGAQRLARQRLQAAGQRASARAC